MIRGIQSNSIQRTILDHLEKSDYEFHLTGSRFFGTETIHSDYDFFTDSNGTIHHFLTKQLGFENVTRANSTYRYRDRLVVAIYHHEAANVHVQVVTDVLLKCIVQDYIKSDFSLMSELRRTSKLSAHKFWNREVERVQKILELYKAHRGPV